MSFVLALLAAQVGALNTPGAAPPLPHQRDTTPLRPPRKAAAVTPAPRAEARACPQTDDGEAAMESAKAWLANAKGRERANAGECLGVALSRLDRWDEAAGAFRAARAAADTPVWRARLGAMAGEAALNGGDAQAALDALAAAAGDAGDDKVMTGGIALYRARALVALKRDAEAEAPLAQARSALPDDATAWLLSATLSRRLNKLPEAQTQIERAAALRPVDPAIGLEAGLIAVLAGRDAAARKSWQSVLAAAPDSAEAATAKGYLAQLDAAAASSSSQPTPKPTEPPSR